MTPKQQYDARKAEREKLKDMDYQLRQRTEQTMMLDIFDRFVTAVERIADAMERQPATYISTTPGGIPWPQTTCQSGSVQS